MATTRKVIILGSGPAGYTAAIYAARANLAPLVLTGVQSGGQLMLTTLVENYPGFVEGIQGPELMETMRKQAEHFGTEMLAEDATTVDFSRQPFAVRPGERPLESHTVIVATGASAKLLGLPAEAKLMGRGVSTCATCDGFFFKDQNIMVVGGGDSALEEALYLPRLEDHAGARLQEPEDRVHLGHGRRRHPRRRAGKGHERAPEEPEDQRLRGAARRRPLSRDRPPAEHTDLPWPDRALADRLREGEARQHADERARGLRRGRRAGPHLS